jgi:hypothetical protein
MNLSRRDLVKLSLAGVAGAALTAAIPLGPWVRAARGAQVAGPGAAARTVIQIWLWGGPSHLDTFDPKPAAGADYTGPLDTTADARSMGVQVGQLLPQLAGVSDKFSLVRSMTHGINAHETAAYVVQTGRKPADAGEGVLVYPSAGAVVSHFKGKSAGYTGLIPPYVVLTEPQGRFSEAGFLGSSCKPFATGGDPAKDPFVVEGVVLPGVSEQRQHARRDLLRKLDTFSRQLEGNPELAALRDCERRAYELILGDAGKVFDLTREPDALRDRYGRTTFGQSCLLARRLAQVGVPYVTINFKGWDTHKQHFQSMRRMLPELDKGLSTLLSDLDSLGMLGSTLVWCSGEFGRTPKVQWEAPWNGGRGHYGAVFSALLAGGGIRGGRLVGASDARGENVKDRPVSPGDLLATVYGQMGISPDSQLPHPERTGLLAVPPAAETGIKTDGPLKELL